jgi:hypothetical protein
MVGLIIVILVSMSVSILWVKGIDNMKQNHPEYKGEDFLNWDEEDKNSIL